MSRPEQLELISTNADGPPGCAALGWKIYRAANIGELRYRCPESKVIEFESLDGEIGRVSWHPSQGGKWGGLLAGREIHVHDHNRKGKKRVLSEIAMAKRDAEREIEVGRLAVEIQRLAQEGEEAARQRANELKPGSPQNTRKRNTLCNEPETLTYETLRIVPAEILKEIGNVAREPHFLMVPMWLLLREEPTLFEKIGYARLALLSGTKGTFTISLSSFGHLINTSANQADKIIRSLRNRNLIRETGRGKRDMITHEFLWHPWMKVPGTTQLSWVKPSNLVCATTQLTSTITEASAGEVGKKIEDVFVKRALRESVVTVHGGEKNFLVDDQRNIPKPGRWQKGD